IINAFYYNPTLTLQVLEQRGATADVFKGWFENIGSFTRVHDKRLSILALCKILSVNPEILPEVVRQGWAQMLEGVVSIFEQYPKALIELKKIKDTAEEEDQYEEYDEFDDKGANIEDDEDTNEGSAHWENDFEELSKHGFSFPSSLDETKDLQEDAYFTSPLDSQDPYIWFQQLWTALPQHPIGSQVVQGLDQTNVLAQKVHVLLQINEEAALKLTL
ncbi:hypothetical protein HK096_001493, partial [Nowakowskiella sp. JEL0078]